MKNQGLTIEHRIARLESAVFGPERKSEAIKPKASTSDFSGATGGIRLLISKGFFSKKRSRSEVRAELAKHDYHYSGPAIQMALNRQSGRSGPLASLNEDGKKVYVKRK